MIRQMPVQEQNIVAFRVSGRLSHADYQAFLPQLEDLMKQYGPLSILLELVDPGEAAVGFKFDFL